MTNSIKIGLAGTGFIAQNFAKMIYHMEGHRYDIVSILTRRKIDSISDFPFQERLTNSVNELIDKSDIILECSGDVLHATKTAKETLACGLPLLTMNSEFQVTTGSHFVDQGYLSECQGDQPGCIAALKEEAEQMGFQPLILGNFKGYLNTNPLEKDMQFWAEKQNFSVKQTTSFTDGTKVQIEQALVANAFNASIFKEGLLGVRTDDFEETGKELAKMADKENALMAEYVISDKQLPTGVFIAAKHNESQRKSLSTYKLGDGPYYVLHTTYHLCAFEILKTVNRVINGQPPLLNNSNNPKISIAAIAKNEIRSDTKILTGIGGFVVRGEAIFADQHPGHVPIGVLDNARITREIEPGQVITYDDIDIEPNEALEIAKNIFS